MITNNGVLKDDLTVFYNIPAYNVLTSPKDSPFLYQLCVFALNFKTMLYILFSLAQGNGWSQRMRHSAFVITYFPLMLWVPAVPEPIELALHRITKKKGVRNNWLA